MLRTRFAPSPTGRLHVGGARTAILNWLVARHAGGAFVLRIEDTDTERNVPGVEAEILEDLRWLGLDWEEGPDVGGPHAPYRQSERAELYRTRAEELVARDAAYFCLCPPAGEAAGQSRPRCPCAARPAPVEHPAGASVRFRVPEGVEVRVDDLVRGPVTFPAGSIEDFVLLRSDGRATYNFAAAMDDAAMGITHVLRGADHLGNTPKQVLLYAAFGWDPPRFAHIPLILGDDRQKLSKRHGATAVREFREAGYMPEALVNYLSLLSWSSPSGEEFLPVERLVAEMDLDRLGASDAVFDREKLRWLSGRYIQEAPLQTLRARLEPFLQAAPVPVDPARLDEALEAIRPRISLLSEAPAQLRFFAGPTTPAQRAARAAVLDDPGAARVLAAVAAGLALLAEWTEPALHAAVREAGQAVGARGRALFHPLRLALTGEEQGPDLATILHLLGRERSLALLRGDTVV